MRSLVWTVGGKADVTTPTFTGDVGRSAPEVFAASLKENKRAAIVGGTSLGCLDGEADVPLGSDGSRLYVAKLELAGAVTGTHYNNVGITPDIAADVATALATATAFLLAKIAATR